MIQVVYDVKLAQMISMKNFGVGKSKASPSIMGIRVKNHEEKEAMSFGITSR